MQIKTTARKGANNNVNQIRTTFTVKVPNRLMCTSGAATIECAGQRRLWACDLHQVVGALSFGPPKQVLA
jgi:hypothetical protein